MEKVDEVEGSKNRTLRNSSTFLEISKSDEKKCVGGTEPIKLHAASWLLKVEGGHRFELLFGSRHPLMLRTTLITSGHRSQSAPGLLSTEHFSSVSAFFFF